MRSLRALAGGVFCLLGFTVSGHAQINIITNRYDSARTSSNLQETVLNVSNVNSSQFGFLYSYPVDGSIYAQPLYAAQVHFPDLSVHNVVYVATMNDKLYAFDADTNGPPLWTRDFTNPSAGVTAIPIVDIVGTNTLNIVGNVGIEGTPAMDLATKTMYFVARTEESGSFVQRLHAVDITTGLDKAGSPVVIQASVSGTAADAVAGVLSFNSKMQQQRVALVLVNGILVIGWGSHEDYEPYHGWLLAYNASTLNQVGAFCTTPNGDKGGIWQGGRAPAIDSAGNLYYTTGNGDWDGITAFSDSVLKFSVGTSGLLLLDWFTPADQDFYRLNDVDLGSSGLTLIPGSNVLVGGGKAAILYLLNSQNLGHQTTFDTAAIQKMNVSAAIFNGPASWNGPAGPLVYLWVGKDFLQSYLFNSTTSGLTPYASGTIASGGTPAGVLAVSSNGTTAGSGIIWGAHPNQANYHGLAPGILRAFDAQTLQEVWDSELVPARDRLGTLAKFVAPIVANGRTYAATADGAVKVYGLLSSLPPDFSINATPPTQTVAAGAAVSYTTMVAAVNGFSGAVALAATGLPSGAGATFTPPSISSGAGSSTLQISTTAVTPVGTYTVTITGTSGTLVHSTTVQLVVSGTPDFSITATPATQTVSAGTAANYTATVAAMNSFSGAVALSASGLPSGATATFTPGSVSGGAGTSALQISTATSTSVGTYTLTVTGTSGTLVHSTTVQLVVSGTPDFSITATPATQTVTAGGAANYTTTLTAMNGFSGTVALGATGLPSGATATFTPPSVSGGAGTSALQISTSATTPAGTYTATVTGTSGTLLHSTTVQLIVSATLPPAKTVSVDFVGTGTAMAATETAGVVAKTHWNAASAAASSSALALVDENGTSTGATLTWQSDNTWSTSIADTAGNFRMMKGYLDNGAGNPTTITATNLPASSTGYDVYVYLDGSNGTGTRSGNYQISGAGIITTTVAATDAGNKDFAGTFTQANGTAGNYVKFTINATGFTLTATPATASDFVLRAPVNGIQIVPSAAATPNFSIAATPPTQTVSPGATANYTTTVTAANGFNGTVALSATGLPGGATATFAPTSVTGGAGTSALQISTTIATPPGIYTVTITGTSGTLVNSTTTQLVVSSGSSAATAIGIDFVGTGTAMAAGEMAGAVPKTNWNAAIGASSSTPLALVDETGTSSGAAVTWQSDNGWGTSIADTAGNFRMMLGYLDNGAGNPTTVTVANLPTSSTGYDVYVYLDGGNGSGTRTGNYQISGAGITTTTVAATDAANADFVGTFTQANGTAGNYVKFTVNATGFTVTATPGTASDFVPRAPVNGIQIVPAAGSADFSLGVAPATRSVAAGSAASYTATVAAVNSFSGTVALSATGLPSGATATFTPTSVPGGAGTSALQIATTAATPAGTSTVTVTGTSGTLVHTTTVQLVVSGTPDFSITATPATQTVAAGSPASYTATVAAVNSFSGAVALSATGLPSGATATFTPTSVPGGAGTSALQIATTAATAAGTYTVTVTGTSGTLVHSTTVQLVVSGTPDFNITATPATQTVAAGSPASYTATVAAVNSFSGTVALSATGLPSGATATFTPASVTGGAGTSSLQIATTAATPVGTYTVTVTGTSGTLVHSTTVQLVVSGTPDFSITATPATRTVGAGGAASYTATIAAVNSFSGTVALSATGLPSGATATFTPASVPGGAGTSALQIATTAATPVGTYTVTVTGTSGTLVHSTTVQLVISGTPDFSIAATPATQTVAAGGAASYTATVAAINSFSGTVALSATALPSGATATFTPTSVPGGAGTSALQIATTAATPVGTYTVTVTGTSGTLVHSTTVQLVVSAIPAAKTISIEFVGTGTVMAATETAGVVAKTHWNAASAATNSTGLALLDETGASTGATVTWRSDNVWSTPITDTAGNFRMMKGYLDNGSGNSTVVTVANLPASATGYDVYVYSDGSNGTATRSGSYQISGSGITTTAIGATDSASKNFTGTFTQANGTAGNYVKFTITAAGFTLTAIPGTASDFTPRAPVNGMQIVPH